MPLPGVAIPQINYNLVPDPAFAGQRADAGPDRTRSMLASVALDAGLGLIYSGAASTGGAQQCGLPASSGDVTNLFVGISEYLAAREPIAGSSNRYAIGDGVSVVEEGGIWVQVDSTTGSSLVDEGPVFLIYSGADKGRFRGDNGGGTATQVTRAKCRIGGLAGSVAQIRINLP